jgi:hypothetical protein
MPKDWLGGWEAGRLAGWEAGRLGGWQAGRPQQRKMSWSLVRVPCGRMSRAPHSAGLDHWSRRSRSRTRTGDLATLLTTQGPETR